MDRDRLCRTAGISSFADTVLSLASFRPLFTLTSCMHLSAVPHNFGTKLMFLLCCKMRGTSCIYDSSTIHHRIRWILALFHQGLQRIWERKARPANFPRTLACHYRENSILADVNPGLSRMPEKCMLPYLLVLQRCMSSYQLAAASMQRTIPASYELKRAMC